MEDTGRFTADVTIRCTQCQEPFRFLGLPCGMDPNGAAVSVDGTEGRFAIGTAETVANIIDGDCAVGFTVSRDDALGSLNLRLMPLMLCLERARGAMEHHQECAQEHGRKEMTQHLYDESSRAFRVLALYKKTFAVAEGETYWNAVRNFNPS